MVKLTKAINGMKSILFTATIISLMTNFSPSVIAQVSNSAPVLDPIHSIQIKEGQYATLNIGATDS